LQKSVKLRVIDEEKEKNRMEHIKREIAISMYVFILGIVIIGVNTALFPFKENDFSSFNSISTYDGMIFFVEVCVMIIYFTFLLYRPKIKQILHIAKILIRLNFHSILNFKKKEVRNPSIHETTKKG
jgi:hypothetical protein